MGKLFLIGAALALSLAVSGAAVADEKAVGSAKTEVALFIGGISGGEHASFSAHNVPGPGACDARGHIVYKSVFAEFNADITELTVLVNRAKLGGIVTKAISGPVQEGHFVSFDAADSGLPGGTGDLFRFAQFGPYPGFPLCFPAIAGQGHPITSGNIVVTSS